MVQYFSIWVTVLRSARLSVCLSVCLSNCLPAGGGALLLLMSAKNKHTPTTHKYGATSGGGFHAVIQCQHRRVIHVASQSHGWTGLHVLLPFMELDIAHIHSEACRCNICLSALHRVQSWRMPDSGALQWKHGEKQTLRAQQLGPPWMNGLRATLRLVSTGIASYFFSFFFPQAQT